jgi:hypothetical protein
MMPRAPILVRRRQALLAALLLPGVGFAGIARGDVLSDVPADALARWLAGSAPHPTLVPDAEWLAYGRREDERWERTLVRVHAMQAWADRELSPVVPSGRPVVYPFAGPDALHAMALFPDAPRLLLLGLEPVGELPDPATTPAPGAFARLGAALEDVHRLTYFRTHRMAADFAQGGVLPALVATVCRMGARITSLARTSSAIRIDWTAPDGRARRLDYVRIDLSNDSLARDGAFAAGVRAMAPYVTFLKAASYLLAEPRFSSVSRILLEDSDVVVQDDSGLRFRALGPPWVRRLFGRYETPVSPFQDRVQPDLAAAFTSRSPPLLPFGIGYHVDAKSSNLLLAAKVGS